MELSEFNQICLKNASKSLNAPGLFDGKMGICLYLFAKGYTDKNNEIIELGEKLIDDVVDEIENSHTYSFCDGLAGIGWGIHYLWQKKYIEADIDETLFDFDLKIIKYLTNNNCPNISLDKGLLGFLKYINQRNINTNLSSHSIYSRVKKELLILIINEIDKYISKNILIEDNPISFDLFCNLPVLIYELSESYNSKVHNVKIERIVDHLLYTIENSIPAIHANRLFLIYSLNHLFREMDSIESHSRIINKIFSTIDFDQIPLELHEYDSSIRFNQIGFLYILKNLKNELYINEYKQNIDELYFLINSMVNNAENMKNFSENKDTTLICGFTGKDLFDIWISNNNNHNTK